MAQALFRVPQCLLSGITDPKLVEAIACRVRLARDNVNLVRNIKGDGKEIYG
jgi:hypothetical protein